MALIDDLATARNQMAARLVEITTTPKPSYNIDGQNISWTAYQKMLMEGIANLKAQIAAEEGPYEVETFYTA